MVFINHILLLRILIMLMQLNSIVLKIELSLPKLFFGNNFDELQYKDFSSVIKKLTEY